MKIAIIGAGATGLAAAYHLVQAGHQVTVFESANTPGGLAGGFTQPEWDWSLEYYYHHWFASDRYIKKLAKDLGISHKLIFNSPSSVVAYRDNFYPLDSPLAIMRFPGLSLGQKIRFGAVTAYLKYISDWKNLEKITAHQWMTHAYGGQVYESIWEPLLKGKFDRYYQQANMAWMWARIKARTPRLGTYLGGFQQFFDDVAEIITSQGVTFSYATKVTHVSARQHKVLIEVQGSKKTFDQCLVTTSPQLFASMTKGLSNQYTQSLSKLTSIGAVMVIVTLNQPLSPHGYYWHNLPKGKKFPFLALVEHTNFVSPKNFNNQHVIYCGDYCPPDHEYFNYSDSKLVNLFTAVFPSINSQFDPSWIQKSFVFRTKYAQPIPMVNHSQNIPSIITPLKNIFLASMSQVYPWDRGTNFAVKLGIDAANQMLSH